MHPTMMPQKSVKVLYVVGWGRSGSTLVGNMLNEVPGFWHTGEVQSIWQIGLSYNQPCGCGLPLRECPVWGNVTAQAFGGISVEDAQAVHTARWDRGPHNRHMLLLPFGGHGVPAVPPTVLSHVSRLYTGLQEETGANVLVDTSKFPSYGYILGEVSTIDVYLLHLVRDSRATAFSWAKEMVRPDTRRSGEPMGRHSYFGSTVKWVGQNLTAELLRGRVAGYKRVRYEDVVTSPVRFVREVGDFLGEDVGSLDFIEDSAVTLGENHTVWGNPSRQRTGRVPLRVDDAWRTGLPAAARRKVTALSWPLLLRYGYHVR